MTIDNKEDKGGVNNKTGTHRLGGFRRERKRGDMRD